MKFKSLSIPPRAKGQHTDREKLTVPNQSMSLHEILERFTRNETLPIGRECQYHESDDDIEKMSKMDLVDRHEYAEMLKQTQKSYDLQQKKKAEKAQKKLEEEALEKARNELKKGFQTD
ncbi:MAG: hypothetical protein [Arizlama microvirus]|nr:MAG: hypothetical protein [Arizlama microvirus]